MKNRMKPRLLSQKKVDAMLHRVQLIYIDTTGRRGRETILRMHKAGWRYVHSCSADLIDPHYDKTHEVTIFARGRDGHD